MFAEFWNLYPRRIGKASAAKAWKKLECSKNYEAIMTAVEKWIESPQWKKDGGQFIPHPATWLNREGWNDEVKIDALKLEWGTVGNHKI